MTSNISTISRSEAKVNAATPRGTEVPVWVGTCKAYGKPAMSVCVQHEFTPGKSVLHVRVAKESKEFQTHMQAQGWSYLAKRLGWYKALSAESRKDVQALGATLPATLPTEAKDSPDRKAATPAKTASKPVEQAATQAPAPAKNSTPAGKTKPVEQPVTQVQSGALAQLSDKAFAKLVTEVYAEMQRRYTQA